MRGSSDDFLSPVGDANSARYKRDEHIKAAVRFMNPQISSLRPGFCILNDGTDICQARWEHQESPGSLS